MRFQGGVRLGAYEILSPLNLAGVGEVYRGRDHERQRDVAIQVLRVDFAERPAMLRRFRDDMGAVAAMTHPNIVHIYNVGTDAHAAYVVSEPLEGETLRGLLNRGGVPLSTAARSAVQIARALAATRKSGIAHQHLSVDHVIVTPAANVKILGFGAAALKDADSPAPRSDLSAFAAILWQMVTANARRSIAPRQRRWLAGGFACALLALAAAVALPEFQTTEPAREPMTTAARGGNGAAAPSAIPMAEEVSPASETESDRDLLQASAAVEPSGVIAPAAAHADVSTPADAAPLVRDPERPSPAPVPDAGASSAAAPVRAAAEPPPPVLTAHDDLDAATLITEASVRAAEFDLPGASNLLHIAAERGDTTAQVASLYVQGLMDARAAFRQGGAALALAPVREATASLEAVAKGRPGSAAIAHLTLQAAAAAAQSERDEMRLYLETAIQMESLQRAAGLPGAPLVSASETAGDLWLLVHRYGDARQAYTDAAERVGFTLRILAGQARSARGLDDMPSACAAYRRLLDAWGARPGLPPEIAEARNYLAQPACAPAGP